MEPTSDSGQGEPIVRAVPTGAELTRLLGDDPLGRALARFVRDEAVVDAARQRATDRWLDAQSEATASLLGVLSDLGESRSSVTIMVSGHGGAQPITGPVVALGRDVVVLADEAGTIGIPLTAVETVAAPDRDALAEAAVRGDRTVHLDTTWRGVLGELALERAPLAVWTTSGTVVRGELVGVGNDVVRIRDEQDRRRTRWVTTWSVSRFRLS